jgi:transposase
LFLEGLLGDPDVRIVRVDRRSKKRFAAVAAGSGTAGTTGGYDSDLSSAGFRIVLELEVRRVACRRCGTVKRERLDFLADNPHFTKRFAFYVGRRCRQASIRDVAKELELDWDTVKTLEKQYMRVQLERAGTPGPRTIGIDEISVREGHSYRIVVSDLVRKRPIWFGGEDRSEASMAAFYDWLGLKKSRKIKLAVMDMWKPFRNVTRDKAPQAATPSPVLRVNPSAPGHADAMQNILFCMAS